MILKTMVLYLAYRGFFMNESEFINTLSKQDPAIEPDTVAATDMLSLSDPAPLGDEQSFDNSQNDVIVLTKSEFGILCALSGISVVLLLIMFLQKQQMRPLKLHDHVID
jgi:hypothetical protein